MKIKTFSMVMMAAMLATSCAMEEVVERNVGQTGDPIDFRPAVTSSTRALSTTLNNLGDFNVFAKGIRSDMGTLYKTFMIGDGPTKPALAEKVSSTDVSGTWKITTDVYWPSDVNTALFWAFTDQKDSDETVDSLCLSSGSVNFLETYGPQIENYTPLKADITQDAGNSTGWFDGDVQKDLVSAFTQQTKDPHVSLRFHHLLSQIEINAYSKHANKDDESRTVKIKGAWVVNVLSSGTLNAQFTYDKNTQVATDNPIWLTSSELERYGSVYTGNDRTVPIVVNNTPGPLNVLGNNGHGNLMLIPQARDSWDGTSTTTTGAYLLLLCRVDMAHKGTVLPGEAVSETNSQGIHYHQQFPVSSYYDEDAYGLTAIPLPVNWEIGKKYVYNLDICGENSGAGKYPPDVPTDSDKLEEYLRSFIPGDYVINAESKPNPTKTNIITKIPAGDAVGDYVLEEPIQFKVTVSDWETGQEWTNGNDQSNQASEE